MTTAQQATAAPAEIHLVGKPYLMAPLTDADMAELDNWIRARAIAAARESLPPGTSEDERRVTIAAAVEAAMGLTWTRGAGSRHMGTLQGTAQVLWMGLRGNHPELTPLAIFAALRRNPKELDEASDVFALLNTVGGSPKGEPADPTTESP